MTNAIESSYLKSDYYIATMHLVILALQQQLVTRHYRGVTTTDPLPGIDPVHVSEQSDPRCTQDHSNNSDSPKI